MIYTTCVMFYAIFSHGRATSTKALIALLVALLALFITLYYHYLKDPLFHQNMFALLTAIVFFRSMYAMEVTLRPSRRAKANESRKGSSREQAREDQRDLAILKTMWQMIPVGRPVSWKLVRILPRFLSRSRSAIGAWPPGMNRPT